MYLAFIIEALVVEKNMYLSRFRHLAGNASNTVVILEPGWQIHVSVVETNQGFSHTPSFLIPFLLPALTVIHNSLRPKCHFDALLRY